jgi:hypothetical protein
MTTQYWLAVLVSWWPFVMFIAAWIVMNRFTRPRTASGATMIDLQEQQIIEAQRTNAALERIAAALDKR